MRASNLFFAGLISVLAPLSTGWSRIGETMDEVLAHYGDPLSTEVYRGSRGNEILQEIRFLVDDVNVVVTMVEGKCVRIYYTQPEPFSDFMIRALMETNSGGRRGKLSEFQSGSEVELKTWTTIDRKEPEITGKVLSGTIEGDTIGGNLEVSTLEYVRAQALLNITGQRKPQP